MSTLDSPKHETSITCTVNSIELKGTRVMEENRRNFELKYGSIVNGLTTALNLQTGFIRSLIAHESRFEVNALNEHGSKGFMQLTSAPINDLLARIHIFTPVIRKIPAEIVPTDAPAPLLDLKKAFDSDPVNKAEIARVVPLLQGLKKHPIVNLVIGHVFFAALEAREGSKIEKREDHIIKTVDTIVGNPRLTAHVFKRVSHLLPGVSPENVVESLEGLEADHSMRSQFLAIKDYNGNKHPYGSGIVHSDIYACTIMSVQMLASKNLQFRKKILPVS